MSKRWKGFSLYLPGTIFIMLGLLVIFFPMLLVALISASLILLGLMAVSIAYRVRRLRQRGEWTITWEPVEPFVGDWFGRAFLYRRR